MTPFTLTAQSFTGSGDRFQQNLQALHVLADLERAQRPATDAEKIILAHFTSFGESALITRLVNRPEQVHDLLRADDIAGLRRAALTAFYTPTSVSVFIAPPSGAHGTKKQPAKRAIANRKI